MCCSKILYFLQSLISVSNDVKQIKDNGLSIISMVANWWYGVEFLLARAQDPTLEVTARQMVIFNLVVTLNENDCALHWSVLCEIIADTPPFFTCEQVYAAIKHLASLKTWQAWVVAYEVYTNYYRWTENRSQHVLENADSYVYQNVISKIVEVVKPFVTGDNRTIVNYASLIFVGFAAKIHHRPVSEDVQRALTDACRRISLIPSYYRECDDIQRFLVNDQSLKGMRRLP